MPDHTVRQFRPDIVDNPAESLLFDFDASWPDVMAYIERLENALDYMGGAQSLLVIEEVMEEVMEDNDNA